MIFLDGEKVTAFLTVFYPIEIPGDVFNRMKHEKMPGHELNSTSDFLRWSFNEKTSKGWFDFFRELGISILPLGFFLTIHNCCLFLMQSSKSVGPG